MCISIVVCALVVDYSFVHSRFTLWALLSGDLSARSCARRVLKRRVARSLTSDRALHVTLLVLDCRASFHRPTWHQLRPATNLSRSLCARKPSTKRLRPVKPVNCCTQQVFFCRLSACHSSRLSLICSVPLDVAAAPSPQEFANDTPLALQLCIAGVKAALAEDRFERASAFIGAFMKWR